MAHAILRFPQVVERTGLPRSTIYAKLADDNFPRPIKLGARSVGWLEAEIQGWLDQRISESANQRISESANQRISESREEGGQNGSL
jgi:prophage regulatory protein